MAVSRGRDDQVPTAIGHFLPIYLPAKIIVRGAPRSV
jgi:hypothetical protein